MPDEKDAGWEFRPNEGPTEKPNADRPGAVVAPHNVESTESEAQIPSVDEPTATIRMTRTADPSEINWTASEFVDHAKSIDWYLAVAVIAVLGALGAYLLVHDILLIIVILVVAITFGFYGTRRPRQLQYRLNSSGITIGEKFLPFHSFRSFAVQDEGVFSSIVLLPLKRFGLLISIYYDPKDEESIVDLISQHLPLEERDHDPVDRFMRRIRF